MSASCGGTSKPLGVRLCDDGEFAVAVGMMELIDKKGEMEAGKWGY